MFNSNKIIGRFDTRVDIAYYNESEPDIEKLKQAKILGEALRTKMIYSICRLLLV